MATTVTEIVKNVYRVSTFLPEFEIAVNQFLINDDEPFLMHTGFKMNFASSRDAIASVMDPAALRWVGFSHLESDECGAMNDWLELAPSAQAICSFIGAVVTIGDFVIRPARPLSHGEIVETGEHRLRFLATPHVPHGWDGGLFFEERKQILLCSDLLFHPGDPEPVTSSDIVGRARASILENLTGPLANDLPYTPRTDQTIQSLADLKPRILALMHGSAFSGDGERTLRDYAAVLKEIHGFQNREILKD